MALDGDEWLASHMETLSIGKKPPEQNGYQAW